MDQLKAALKVLLADTFVMYFKTHTYHWNVEGMFFTEYHKFFGGLYEELHDSIDDIAEHIRACADDYAPMSLMEMYNYKTLSEDSTKPTNVTEMLNNLIAANNVIIADLDKVFQLGEAVNNQGLLEFISGRLDTHHKHAWMLKASAKNTGA